MVTVVCVREFAVIELLQGVFLSSKWLLDTGFCCVSDRGFCFVEFAIWILQISCNFLCSGHTFGS